MALLSDPASWLKKRNPTTRRLPDSEATAANADEFADRISRVDCLIIGAGPGGLTAAIYLRRDAGTTV